MRLYLKKRCTCSGMFGLHGLNCDLMYRKNFRPKKRKKFFIFYPLKRRWRQ